jgi:putative hemolysin
MRFFVLIVTAAILLSACSGIRGESQSRAEIATPVLNSASNQNLAPSSPEAADGNRTLMVDRFVQRLAAVADAGALFDVSATMHLLDIGYRAETADAIPLPPDCHIDWHPKQVTRTTITTDERSWYTSTPFGESKWTTAQALAVRPPSIQYTVDHTIRCTGRFRMQDGTEAHLKFTSLPAYACITKSDIRRVLPAAHPSGGGIGAPVTTSLIGYSGRTNDDIGTMITFTFYSSSPCATQVEIQQSQEGGYRFRRALWNHQVCVAEEQHDYCVAHGGTSISPADLQGISAYVDTHCPTINAMYLKEPRSGQIAPTGSLQPLFKPNPCGF